MFRATGYRAEAYTMDPGFPSRSTHRMRAITAASAAMAGLLLPVWSCSNDPLGPGPEALCRNGPDSAVVTFADENLALAIYSELSLSPLVPLTCGRLLDITDLNAADRGIVRLQGLENLTNLTTLWIRANEIMDIGPLAGLTRLTSLNLADNAISDLRPLSGLTDLTFLAVNQNGVITDVTPLRSLTKLSGTLWIGENAITDLSPLAGLAGLTAINAWDNAITDVSGLAGLTGLTALRLHINRIEDVGALRGLSALRTLTLQENPDLADISPLLDNPGLAAGGNVNLRATSVSCADVAALEALGAAVISDCP